MVNEMYAVTYKSRGIDGVVYIPCQNEHVARVKADALYKKGYFNIKVVIQRDEIIYTTSGIK